MREYDANPKIKICGSVPLRLCDHCSIYSRSSFNCFVVLPATVCLQVADLHGELLEFNERLHKQVSYYQYQVRRLREELVNLRGPVRSKQTKLGSRSSQGNRRQPRS